jgi:hypothetical protein
LPGAPTTTGPHRGRARTILGSRIDLHARRKDAQDAIDYLDQLTQVIVWLLGRSHGVEDPPPASVSISSASDDFSAEQIATARHLPKGAGN